MLNHIKKNGYTFVSLLFSLGIFGLLILSSCSDDDKSTKASFTMELTSSLPKAGVQAADTLFFTDPSGTVFSITEARVNVRDIELDFPEGSSDTNQVQINGPFLIDLLTGISNPDIGNFQIEPGVYKRIDVRLDDTKLSDGLVDASDPLLDNTLVVRGQFSYNSVPDRNYSIILKFNEDVRFEDPGGITIESNSTTDIILQLEIDQWLQNADITDCLDNSDLTLDPNGDLVLDDANGSGNCSDIENTIKDNVKNNSTF